MARVLLTGASGFVGVHTLRQLLEDGHTVRAFVRDPARLADHVRPLGIEPQDPRVEVARGDMTDAGSVREAVGGCDAVVHAAATFSYKRRDRQRMERENAVGTRTVLEAGVDAGADSLVHVSSTVALARPGGATLDHTSPLGPGLGPYTASKVASEAVARELQDARAPVTIVNPGAIIGPHDPYLGESNDVVAQVLAGRVPAWPRGCLHFVDVRDVAAVISASLDRPGRRFLVPGHSVPALHPVLRQVTGRRLPAPTVPPAALAATAMPGYLTGWRLLPGAVEGIRVIGCANPVDAAATSAATGLQPRPLEESVRDTLRWLVSAGHLKPKHIGRAAA